VVRSLFCSGVEEGMAKPSKEKQDLELHPDAWQRFEGAASVVAKTPPQHRKTKKKSKTSTSNKTKREWR
jgi:hypothetical protein